MLKSICVIFQNQYIALQRDIIDPVCILYTVHNVEISRWKPMNLIW